MPNPSATEQPIEVKNRIHRLPLLGQNHSPLNVTRQMRNQSFLHEEGGQTAAKVESLAFFTVVDAAGMMRADPSTPSMEIEASTTLVSGKRRAANEPQVRVESGIGECLCKAGHAARDTTGSRVPIRTFERQDMNLHSVTNPTPPQPCYSNPHTNNMSTLDP
jgi:hypothetical protein